VRRAALALSGALLASCTARVEEKPKPPVAVDASVDRAETHVGDLVTYRLVVDREASIPVEIPALASGAGGFDVVDSTSNRREGRGRVVEERRFVLRTFEVGKHEIPEAIVRYGEKSAEKTASAPAIDVEVKSLLPEDATAEIQPRDVKPPLPLPAEKPKWALWVGAAIAIVGAAVVLLFARRRRAAAPAAPAEPPRPPHEIALRDLRALRARDLPGKGEIDLHVVELTGIVRRYIEARFGVSAPEMTTDEFLAEVGRGRLLDAAPSELVRDLLRRADLVKFAAYRPTRFEADELLAAAERFVEQTKASPALDPVPEAVA
jgi:hypothetical protein